MNKDEEFFGYVDPAQNAPTGPSSFGIDPKNSNENLDWGGTAEQDDLDAQNTDTRPVPAKENLFGTVQTPQSPQSPNADSHFEPTPSEGVPASFQTSATKTTYSTNDIPEGVMAGPAPTSHPVIPVQKTSRKKNFVVAGIVGAVVFAGGGAYAMTILSGGGGVQPEMLVPANAVAFAKVDFDPSAGQKIAALRFLSAFPESKVNDKGDLRDEIFSKIFDGTEKSDNIIYETDIKSWLGKKYAIAVIPTGAVLPKKEPNATGSPNFDPLIPPPPPLVDSVVIVEVTDVKAAEAGLKKIFASIAASGAAEQGAEIDSTDGNTLAGYAVADNNYVVLAETNAKAQKVVDEAKKANLAADPEYTADIKKLSEDQVVVGWVDVGESAKLAESYANSGLFGLGGPSALISGASGVGNPTGRVFGGLHFDSQYAEIEGGSTGTNPTPAGKGEGKNLVQQLPADTAAAFNINGLGAALVDTYSKVNQKDGLFDLGELSKGFDLNLPEDLETFLGSQTMFAFGVGESAQSSEEIKAVMRTVNADKPAAKEVADKLQVLAKDTGREVGTAETPDGWAYATDQKYADEIAKGNGSLGSTDQFKKALPDADGAGSLLYLDINRLAAAFNFDGSSKSEFDEYPNLGAVGVTANAKGNEGSFRARLTLKEK